MTTHEKQVNIHTVHIDRHMTHSLYCICMEQDAMFFCNFTDFSDRLDCTDLIICKHHRNQDCFRANSVFQFLQTDAAKLVHIQISHFHTFLFQIFRCMQNGVMFDFCCDDMFLFFITCIYHTTESHVITFRTTCCEVNFFRICTDQICDLFSCMFKGFFTFFCNGIYTGGIAIIFSEIRQDRLQHFFSYGCCCRIIHINSCCHFDTPLLLYFYIILFSYVFCDLNITSFMTYVNIIYRYISS